MVATSATGEEPAVRIRTLSLSLLRHQHHDLVQRIDRVRVLAAQRQNGRALRRELLALRADVNHHLACEDNLFYAVLRHHHDPEVRRLVVKVNEAVAGLAPAFIAFTRRWLDVDATGSHPLGFWLALERITNELRLRIWREERDIYPFIERHL